MFAVLASFFFAFRSLTTCSVCLTRCGLSQRIHLTLVYSPEVHCLVYILLGELCSLLFFLFILSSPVVIRKYLYSLKTSLSTFKSVESLVISVLQLNFHCCLVLYISVEFSHLVVYVVYVSALTIRSSSKRKRKVPACT